jgi:hypothetical protein
MSAASVTARRAQGTWYVVTGVWPILSFRTFEAVVGPKPDRFQTQATGLVFVAVGLALQPWRNDPYPDTSGQDVALSGTARLLAVATAGLTAAIELAYRRKVRPVFLADAALETVFAAAALAGTRLHVTAEDT